MSSGYNPETLSIPGAARQYPTACLGSPVRMSLGYNSRTLTIPGAARQYPPAWVPQYVCLPEITLELYRFRAQRAKILRPGFPSTYVFGI